MLRLNAGTPKMKGILFIIIAVLFVPAIMSMSSCSKDNPSVDPPGPNPPTGGKDTTTRSVGITAQQVRNAKGGLDEFVLFLPKNYNAEPRKNFPLIIFLHGQGERGDNLELVKKLDLPKYAENASDFGFILVTPQCKADTWWDVPSLRVLYDQILKDYNVDPSQIYLTGLSMGGYGVWSWAQVSPQLFSAIVPICGGGDVAANCPLAAMPAWVFHNADDPQVSVDESRKLVKAMRDCGNDNVKYTENATGGHNAWTAAYNNPELYSWLLSNKK
ncbi:carboxylesterase family protein [Chitinophaga caeni]|uniref:carboxylesterase family protein n=1 Tax=Chitinophaga caeni TaxID=2029983 RepID=UPI0018E0AB15|nr:hypothetical protein [Chitinophaga caeni]